MTVVLFSVESFNFLQPLSSSDGCGLLFGVVGCGHNMFVINLFKETNIRYSLSFQKRLCLKKELGNEYPIQEDSTRNLWR